MAMYKLAIELQHIFLGGEPLEKDLSCSLILKDNDLTNFLFQLMDAGYEPGISHDLGNISSIRLRLNNVYYFVKDQHLSQYAIQDQVVLSSEDTYTAMSQAATAFNNQLFKKYHKSSYSEEDIAVFG